MHEILAIFYAQMLYWYIAKNERGEVGTVPGNYLNPIKPPPVPTTS